MQLSEGAWHLSSRIEQSVGVCAVSVWSVVSIRAFAMQAKMKILTVLVCVFLSLALFQACSERVFLNPVDPAVTILPPSNLQLAPPGKARQMGAGEVDINGRNSACGSRRCLLQSKLANELWELPECNDERRCREVPG